jgi:hypothetical protein
MKVSYVVGGVAAVAAIVIVAVVLSHKSPCNAGVCKVTVTVQDCAGGGITASPDPVKVPTANNIEWTIDTDGFLFTTTGITVQGTASPTILARPATARNSSFMMPTRIHVQKSNTPSRCIRAAVARHARSRIH